MRQIVQGISQPCGNARPSRCRVYRLIGREYRALRIFSFFQKARSWRERGHNSFMFQDSSARLLSVVISSVVLLRDG